MNRVKEEKNDEQKQAANIVVVGQHTIHDYNALQPLNNSEPLEMENRLLSTFMKNDTVLDFISIRFSFSNTLPRIGTAHIHTMTMVCVCVGCQERISFRFVHDVWHSKVLQVGNLCKDYGYWVYERAFLLLNLLFFLLCVSLFPLHYMRLPPSLLSPPTKCIFFPFKIMFSSLWPWRMVR